MVWSSQLNTWIPGCKYWLHWACMHIGKIIWQQISALLSKYSTELSSAVVYICVGVVMPLLKGLFQCKDLVELLWESLSMGICIVEERRSDDRLSSTMEIPILGI